MLKLNQATMSSDCTVVQILVCAGLVIQLLLTLCSVDARPTFDSFTIKDSVSQTKVLDHEAVLIPVYDPRWKDPEAVLRPVYVPRWKDPDQTRIESSQVKTPYSGQPRKESRLQRRVRSTENGNVRSPRKESGEQNVDEFHNNISTPNNYRHRNGWGGGYGK